MANGAEYRSTPETALKPVEIQNLGVSYEKELQFIEADGGKFAPGHRIALSFNDPETEENYYYWTFRTYENLSVCQRCINGYYRNNDCQGFGQVAGAPPYYDYSCEVECWKIRFPEGIAIFEDKFSNGRLISNLSV